MVGTFRQSGVGQVMVGLIVALIVGAFVLGGSAIGVTGLSQECAAEVGRHCIDPKEYYAAYGLMSSIGLNERAAKQLQLRAQIAEGLIERELLQEEADRLGISISEDQLDEELAAGRTRVSLPAARAEQLALSLAMCVEGPAGCAPGTIGLRALPVLRDGVLDYEQYTRVVRMATGRNPGVFKEQQKRELTAERMRELIRSNVRVSEEEAFLAYERGRSKATIRTVQAQADWFSRFAIQPSDSQIEDWAVDHKAEVDAALAQEKERWKADCPMVSEIRLDLDPIADDDEKQSRRALLEEARARLEKGADFALLARELSDGAEGAWGGALGCLDQGYGAGGQTLLTALDGLEPGQTSQVIESVRGLHLIRFERQLTEADVDVAARQHVARRLATSGLGREAAARYARELIERAQKGETLEAAAEALNRSYAEAGPLGPANKDGKHAALESALRPKAEFPRPFTIDQNPLPSARPGKSVAALAFQLDKDDDVAPEPIDTFDGYAVLQLKSKEMAQREDFEAEKAELLERLRARKAEDALVSYVNRLRQRAGSVKLNPRHVPTEGSGSDDETPGGEG